MVVYFCNDRVALCILNQPLQPGKSAHVDLSMLCNMDWLSVVALFHAARVGNVLEGKDLGMTVGAGVIFFLLELHRHSHYLSYSVVRQCCCRALRNCLFVLP